MTEHFSAYASVSSVLGIFGNFDRNQVQLAGGDNPALGGAAPQGAAAELQPLHARAPELRLAHRQQPALAARRQLRARHGEHDPDLVRLTGLYNNLLRTWSEV